MAANPEYWDRARETVAANRTFRRLRKSLVRQVLERTHPLSCEDGETIIRQGAPGEFLAVFVEGTARAELVGPGGERQVVAEFSPGDVIGVGLETPEIDREAMRQQMGARGGRRGGGGRGGRSGMGRAGGGRGGMGRAGGGQQRPDPLKLWTTVTLAATE